MGQTYPGRRAILASLFLGSLAAACTPQADEVLSGPLAAPDTPATQIVAQEVAKERKDSGPTALNGELAARLPSAAPVGSKSRLTLEEAARRAVAWHPSVDEAVAKLNESGQNIKTAEAGYYPKLRGGVDSGYDSMNSGSSGFRPRFNVSASQMLYDFGKVSSAVDAETAGADVSRAQLLRAIDGLIRDTSYAVIEVQRNRALLAVAQEQLKGVKGIADLVAQRNDKGASTRSDKVQAQARVEAAQSTILQTAATLSRWESTLASLIGTGMLPPLVTGVPAWLGKSCVAPAPAWPDVPAIMEATSQKRRAQALLQQAQAQSLPTLSLDAGASYAINQQDRGNLDYDPRRPQYSVKLAVSSSLYDPATGSRSAAANFALRAADAAENTARYEITRGLSEARSQTASLGQLQGSLSSRIGMMSETRDLYRQQYLELGTRTLLDLLNAEQELRSAQFDVVNTEHDVRRLNVDCLFNSGLMRKSFALSGTVVRGVSL